MARIIDQTYKLLSGYEMPVLGLGTWELTGTTCESAVAMALELGYRHIDTAELYGNEVQIGRAIKKADRSQLFITSKVSSSNLRTDDVVGACQASLKRLDTDYLDLYLVHWPNDTIGLEQAMEGMHKLVTAGKVRSVGLSNFGIGRMEQAMAISQSPICNNQIEHHPYRRQHAIPQFCDEHSITVTAYSPLARAKVVDDPTLQRIGKNYAKSAVQVSLRWLLHKGAIVIPKASSGEHLKADMELNGWELSAEDVEAIDSLGVEKKLVDTSYT